METGIYGMTVTLTYNRFYETRGAQSVNLYRLPWAKSPTGIFYCQILNGSNNSSMIKILYIGLYDTGAASFNCVPLHVRWQHQSIWLC